MNPAGTQFISLSLETERIKGDGDDDDDDRREDMKKVEKERIRQILLKIKKIKTTCAFNSYSSHTC